jgi:hypothetical protein
LIRDDTPGGFGFVDDYILLRAGQLEQLKARRDTSLRKQIEAKIGSMASILPASVKPQMQAGVDGLSALIQLIGAFPVEMQLMTMQALIANPLQGAMPQAPPGLSPRAGFPVSGVTPGLVWEGQHTWSDGDRIGVSFPGGGGVVTDGRNVFPI